MIPMNESSISNQECEKIREIGGVVILQPFGVDVSRKTQRILSLLNNQDCKVLGMIVSLADEDFLNSYYA